MGQLNGKVAVVIGAAGRGNMGQVIARAFASEGAQLVVAGRDAAQLREFADEIGGEAVVCDICNEEELKRLADTAADRFGALDIALNATGWDCSSHFSTPRRLTSRRSLLSSSPVRSCSTRPCCVPCATAVL
jgi:NAD(P)-dependent dehydrogenase (short-subunit alcohol dehydrogenase family)